MQTSDGVTMVISGGGKVVGVECCGGNGVAAVLELRRGNTCGGEGFGAALGRKRTRKRGILRDKIMLRGMLFLSTKTTKNSQYLPC